MTEPNPSPDAGLVAVTATVKGSAAQVRRFAAANLRAGADHVLVFVDDGDPQVLESLEQDAELSRHVTAIGTDADYWRRGQRRVDRPGEVDRSRPPNLNRRQKVNANLANTLVCTVPRF